MNNKTFKQYLILLDLDGTTLTDDFNLHPKVLKAVELAKKQGHIVCLLTARPFRASYMYYDQLKMNTLIGNFSGGYIHNPISDNIQPMIFSISDYIINEIINEESIKTKVKSAMVEGNKKFLVYNKTPFMQEYYHLPNGKSEIDAKFEKFSDNEANNLVLGFKMGEDLNDVFRTLIKYLASVTISIKEEPSERLTFISINSNLVSKGNTAKILAQHYGIKAENVVAIGDELNDISMIQFAGHGVAMANGNDNLKIAANYITKKTNNEGGAGEFILEFLSK